MAYALRYYVSLRSDLIREASNFDAMEQSIKLASAREAKAVSARVSREIPYEVSAQCSH